MKDDDLIYDATDFDVKLGRGKGFQLWTGNLRYREVIDKFREEKDWTKQGKTVKETIIDEVLEELGEKTRFLQSVERSHGGFHIISKDKMKEKIKQALREKPAERKKKKRKLRELRVKAERRCAMAKVILKESPSPTTTPNAALGSGSTAPTGTNAPLGGTSNSIGSVSQQKKQPNPTLQAGSRLSNADELLIALASSSRSSIPSLMTGTGNPLGTVLGRSELTQQLGGNLQFPVSSALSNPLNQALLMGNNSLLNSQNILFPNSMTGLPPMQSPFSPSLRALNNAALEQVMSNARAASKLSPSVLENRVGLPSVLLPQQGAVTTNQTISAPAAQGTPQVAPKNNHHPPAAHPSPLNRSPAAHSLPNNRSPAARPTPSNQPPVARHVPNTRHPPASRCPVPNSSRPPAARPSQLNQPMDARPVPNSHPPAALPLPNIYPPATHLSPFKHPPPVSRPYPFNHPPTTRPLANNYPQVTYPSPYNHPPATRQLPNNHQPPTLYNHPPNPRQHPPVARPSPNDLPPVAHPSPNNNRNPAASPERTENPPEVVPDASVVSSMEEKSHGISPPLKPDHNKHSARKEKRLITKSRSKAKFSIGHNTVKHSSKKKLPRQHGEAPSTVQKTISSPRSPRLLNGNKGCSSTRPVFETNGIDHHSSPAPESSDLGSNLNSSDRTEQTMDEKFSEGNTVLPKHLMDFYEALVSLRNSGGSPKTVSVTTSTTKETK